MRNTFVVLLKPKTDAVGIICWKVVIHGWSANSHPLGRRVGSSAAGNVVKHVLQLLHVVHDVFDQDERYRVILGALTLCSQYVLMTTAIKRNGYS